MILKNIKKKKFKLIQILIMMFKYKMDKILKIFKLIYKIKVFTL